MAQTEVRKQSFLGVLVLVSKRKIAGWTKMAWMLEETFAEDVAASGHPLLGFPAADVADYDGTEFSFVK